MLTDTFEISRMARTLGQSVASPVLSSVLYFIVFGSAMGSQVKFIEEGSYGSFIVPGLVMLSVLTQSISNAAFGIFFPRFSGAIYEVLSAPLSSLEIALGYVGAATSKSVFIALLILLTSTFFVHPEIENPFMMLILLTLISLTFSLFGFLIGVCSRNFEHLQFIPLLVVTPLSFLGGVFYSISILPPFWQKLSLLNPIVYLMSLFRWSFSGHSDVSLLSGWVVLFTLLTLCVLIIHWVFLTGYRLRT